MREFIKEERYIFFIGKQEHIVRVQELFSDTTMWPERFRIQVPASYLQEGKNLYGTTAQEVVERAIEYISSPVHERNPSPSPLLGRLD